MQQYNHKITITTRADKYAIAKLRAAVMTAVSEWSQSHANGYDITDLAVDAASVPAPSDDNKTGTGE